MDGLASVVFRWLIAIAAIILVYELGGPRYSKGGGNVMVAP